MSTLNLSQEEADFLLIVLHEWLENNQEHMGQTVAQNIAEKLKDLV
jgi:hypothetical protein